MLEIVKFSRVFSITSHKVFFSIVGHRYRLAVSKSFRGNGQDTVTSFFMFWVTDIVWRFQNRFGVEKVKIFEEDRGKPFTPIECSSLDDEKLRHSRLVFNETG